MANTKLLLFYSWMDRSADISRRLPNLPIINHVCEYNYEFVMPVVEASPVREEYTGLFGKKKTRVKGYNHLLCFPKELTEEELRWWRIWKLGYCTCCCSPQRT